MINYYEMPHYSTKQILSTWKWKYSATANVEAEKWVKQYMTVTFIIFDCLLQNDDSKANSNSYSAL